MIPVLYEHSERTFETQGLGSLTDAISCTVTEELNSTYELQMSYPIDGIHFEDIITGRIILAEPAPKKEAEPFSIYKITKPIDGIVIVYAEHISYMLNLIPVKPFSANSCAAALKGLVDNSIEENPFTVWTDKNVNSKFVLTIPQAFRKCLGGVDGSILDTYKGEFEFNRFTVKLHTNRGHLKESAKIIYGKNLVDLTQEESISNVVTGVIPYWKGTVDDNDVTVMLPENKVESEYAKQYAYNRTIPYDFSSEFQEQPTVDQLRAVAEAYVKNNLTGKPDVSITVSFVSLADSEENKGFASELLYLGDSVPVYFFKLGIESSGEIVSCTYDVLSGRYETITIGSVKSSLASAIKEVQDVTINVVNKAYLDQIIEFQKKLINGGYGGYKLERYVNGHPSETIWGDTDDIETMVNCIRINKNGIGISNNGINGPYVIAGTISGHFNASMIDTGILTANIIKAGILSNKDGSFWINFDTNEFYLAGMAKKDDLNAIQIGGRNLARWTYSDWSKWYSEFSGIQNTCVPVSNQVLTKGLKVGDTVIFKMEYKYQNIVATSGQKAECWLQGSGNNTAWNAGAFPGSSRCELSGSGTHTFEGTFTVSADHLKNDYWSLNIRHDYVQSGSISFRMLKVEKGTKATDWTPAPEDLESYADSASQNAVNALDQTTIFNKLTNNGQAQGLALVDGKLYLNAEYLVSKIIKGLTISGSTVQGSKIVFGEPNGTYRVEASYREESQSWEQGWKPKGVIFETFNKEAGISNISDRFVVRSQSTKEVLLWIQEHSYSILRSYADDGERFASVTASSGHSSSGYSPSAGLICKNSVSDPLDVTFVNASARGAYFTFNKNNRRFLCRNSDGALVLEEAYYLKELMTVVSTDDGVVTIKAKTRLDINAGEKNDGIIAINGYKAVRDNSPGNHNIYLRWTGSSLVARVDISDVWNTSDRRLKDKITNISDDYVDAIGSVEMKEFIFTDPIYDQSIKHFGVIAQDVREALEGKGINPEEIAVNSHFDRDGEEYYTIDKDEFLMARVAYDEKLIKQQAETISKLTERLNRLEELINANNQN